MYRKLPFGLKNAGATCQRAMDYAFYDIWHIVEAYLNDLRALSKKRTHHLAHIKQIFSRCRFYNIRLNPHTCLFFIESGRLLGFIVSKDGIRVDPNKVKAIIELPAPRSILQLQHLQGKEKLLCRFIVNYVEMTKGFMCLIKKGIPYLWDDQDQLSFDALK